MIYFLVILLFLMIQNTYTKNVAYNLPIWVFNETLIVKRNESPKVPMEKWKNHTTSHNSEDLFAYRNYFYGVSNGLVLETGIGQFSSTFFFESVADWRSIHVEIDGNVFKQLLHRRPNSINVHGALCSSSREVHFVPSKHETQGIYEFLPKEFLKLWHPQLLDNPQKVKELQPLLCIPVSKLLSLIGIKHIDLWIMDNHLGDGSDTEVLQGLDLNQQSISVITFHESRELVNDNHSKPNENKVHILEKLGYNCDMLKAAMRWCVHKAFVPSKMP